MRVKYPTSDGLLYGPNMPRVTDECASTPSCVRALPLDHTLTHRGIQSER